VMNMSAVATPNHDLWRVRNITYNSRVRPFNSRLNRREGLTTGRTLEMGVVVGRLRRFAHAIAIVAAAITSAAAADLPEISLQSGVSILHRWTCASTIKAPSASLYDAWRYFSDDVAAR
jgi:hypothetical protein